MYLHPWSEGYIYIYIYYTYKYYKTPRCLLLMLTHMVFHKALFWPYIVHYLYSAY